MKRIFEIELEQGWEGEDLTPQTILDKIPSGSEFSEYRSNVMNLFVIIQAYENNQSEENTIKLIRAYYETNFFDKAEEKCILFLETFKESTLFDEIYYTLGELRLRKNSGDSALGYFIKSKTEADKEPKTKFTVLSLLGEAKIYEKGERWEEALNEYSALETICDTTNSDYNNVIGINEVCPETYKIKLMIAGAYREMVRKNVGNEDKYEIAIGLYSPYSGSESNIKLRVESKYYLGWINENYKNNNKEAIAYYNKLLNDKIAVAESEKHAKNNDYVIQDYLIKTMLRKHAICLKNPELEGCKG